MFEDSLYLIFPIMCSVKQHLILNFLPLQSGFSYGSCLNFKFATQTEAESKLKKSMNMQNKIKKEIREGIVLHSFATVLTKKFLDQSCYAPGCYCTTSNLISACAKLHGWIAQASY